MFNARYSIKSKIERGLFMKKKSERNRSIYQERKQGKTYTELAEKYALSAMTVTRICEIGELIEANPIYDLLQAVCDDENIVMRTFQALRRKNITTKEEFLRYDESFYKKMRLIGPCSMELINRAMKYCRNEG